jgi:hypothetical protein
MAFIVELEVGRIKTLLPKLLENYDLACLAAIR